jgi:hypothetical protein
MNRRGPIVGAEKLDMQNPRPTGALRTMPDAPVWPHTTCNRSAVPMYRVHVGQPTCTMSHREELACQ